MRYSGCPPPLALVTFSTRVQGWLWIAGSRLGRKVLYPFQCPRPKIQPLWPVEHFLHPRLLGSMPTSTFSEPVHVDHGWPRAIQQHDCWPRLPIEIAHRYEPTVLPSESQFEPELTKKLDRISDPPNCPTCDTRETYCRRGFLLHIQFHSRSPVSISRASLWKDHDTVKSLSSQRDQNEFSSRRFARVRLLSVFDSSLTNLHMMVTSKLNFAHVDSSFTCTRHWPRSSGKRRASNGPPTETDHCLAGRLAHRLQSGTRVKCS